MHDSISDQPTLDHTWIHDQDTLRAWFDAIEPGAVIAMDTEFIRRSTFYAQLSLLQVAHGTRLALVDPLAFDMGSLLLTYLQEREITCIMHSAGEDMEALAPWLPDGPPHLFDTQTAAGFCGHDAGISYRSLVQSFCAVTLDKGETRSNWNRRPLSPAQIHYALLDVVYLEPIYRELQTQLQARHMQDYFAQDMDALKQRARIDAIPEQPQLKLRSAGDYTFAQQVRLRRILVWREQQARALNKPRKWVFDDALALALTADTDGQNKHHLLAQTRLSSAQQQALEALLTAPVTPAEKQTTRAIAGVAERMPSAIAHKAKAIVQTKAKEMDIPASLMCSRKRMEFLWAYKTWPKSLHGWRRQLLQEAFVPLFELPA